MKRNNDEMCISVVDHMLYRTSKHIQKTHLFNLFLDFPVPYHLHCTRKIVLA